MSRHERVVRARIREIARLRRAIEERDQAIAAEYWEAHSKQPGAVSHKSLGKKYELSETAIRNICNRYLPSCNPYMTQLGGDVQQELIGA